jgi:hypothetical protein
VDGMIYPEFCWVAFSGWVWTWSMQSPYSLLLAIIYCSFLRRAHCPSANNSDSKYERILIKPVFLMNYSRHVPTDKLKTGTFSILSLCIFGWPCTICASALCIIKSLLNYFCFLSGANLNGNSAFYFNRNSAPFSLAY